MHQLYNQLSYSFHKYFLILTRKTLHLQAFVPIAQARNAGERSSAEHLCGQASPELQRRADGAVRPVDQRGQQRLGYLLLGHRGEAHAQGVRHGDHGAVEGARQERRTGHATPPAGSEYLGMHLVLMNMIS